MNKGDRCKLSPKGLESLASNKGGRGNRKYDGSMRGTFNKWSRDRQLCYVKWDGNKLDTVLHSSFVEPDVPT